MIHKTESILLRLNLAENRLCVRYECVPKNPMKSKIPLNPVMGWKFRSNPIKKAAAKSFERFVKSNIKNGNGNMA